MALVTAFSLRGALDAFLAQSEELAGNFRFLLYFTTSGDLVYSYATFLSFIGPIMGIALGFDAVNNERSQGTLNRLAAQPIYRDEIINAKFLAALVTVISIIVPMLLIFVGSAIITGGVTPGCEDAARMLLFAVYTIVYTALWLAISVIFSVICNKASTSIMASMGLWLFLTFFWTFISTAAADLIYPIDQAAAQADVYNNYSLGVALGRFSPYYIFIEAVNTILNPSIRGVGVAAAGAYDGAVTSFLSFDQSVMLVWPHLTALFALAVIGFAAAYISFMRQEIRA